METIFIIGIIFEAVLMIAGAWGIFHEDCLIAFENRIAPYVKRPVHTVASFVRAVSWELAERINRKYGGARNDC